MTQRRRIAIAYAFAVPVVLVVVFFLRAAILGVSGSAGEMAEAADVIRETDAALALLKEAGAHAQKYIASGGDTAAIRAYQDSVTELHKTLQEIGEETKDEQSIRAKYQALGPLVGKQIGLFDQAMAASRKKITARDKAAPVVESRSLMDDIGQIMMEINAVQQVRLQQQSEATTRSIRLAKMLTTYGGGVLIWIVGVGAFLLFHDEKARVWAGVERRVHTNVLQTLPLGVSVATETGLIVYANPAEEALMGYERGELLGNNAKILHALEGKGSEQTVNEILEQLNEDKIWKGELPVRGKNGTIKNIPSWVMNLAFPGKLYRVFVHRSE